MFMLDLVLATLPNVIKRMETVFPDKPGNHRLLYCLLIRVQAADMCENPIKLDKSIIKNKFLSKREQRERKRRLHEKGQRYRAASLILVNKDINKTMRKL